MDDAGDGNLHSNRNYFGIVSKHFSSTMHTGYARQKLYNMDIKYTILVMITHVIRNIDKRLENKTPNDFERVQSIH